MNGITRKVEFKNSTLPTLSVCMIVKNEEENLKRLLPVLKDVVEEIVIVDTGSEDRSIDIARFYTEKVHTFPWINDFSKARNESISHATKDYILWLDADDQVTKQDLIKLKYHLKIHAGTAVFLTLVDKRLDREFRSLQLRVFPNNKGLRFSGKVHEQISFAVEALGIKYSTCDVKIFHTGYSSKEKVEDKLRRNAEIGSKELLENPDDFMLNLTQSRTYLGLGELEKARPLVEKTLDLIKEGKTGVSKENEFLAYLGKVTILCNDGKNEEAIEFLKKAETYFSNDELLKLTLGELSFKNKDYKTAYKKLLGLKNDNYILGLSPVDISGMVKQLSVFLLISSLYIGDIDTAEFCVRKMINDQNFKIKRG